VPEAVDAFRYISYMGTRWRLIGASCGVAVSLALGANLIMPRQYTATARVVIEPPAGSDPRGSIAVSPIYLESLRTYEHFASSDSLFQKAEERFGLRRMLGARPIESLKKRVLRVETVRNTRILEISATLPDARTAQALAQFLADGTVALNRSMVSEGDRDLVKGVEQADADARARLEEVNKAWSQLLASEPIDDLQTALDSAGRLREDLQQQASAAELEIADAAERVEHATAGDAAEIRRQQASAQARLEELHRRIEAADRLAAQREKLLASRIAHRDSAAAQRKEADEALSAAEARLRAARAESGYRGERLTVIDPGVVPERPSSPNLPLNVGAALLLGLVLPLLYLAFEMNYREQNTGVRRTRLRAMEKAFDD
jgi:capsular polysaccharide biosynthesis protein